MTCLERLQIICRRQACGEPAPLAQGRRKRLMVFAGLDWLEQATFLCPECGTRRFFTATVSGVLKETTGESFFARLMRFLFRQVLDLFVL